MTRHPTYLAKVLRNKESFLERFRPPGHIANGVCFKCPDLFRNILGAASHRFIKVSFQNKFTSKYYKISVEKFMIDNSA